MSRKPKAQMARENAKPRAARSAKLPSPAASPGEKATAGLPEAMASKQGRFLHRIMTRMFAVVGRVFTPEETSEPEWYYTSTWTDEQERAFKDYFVREIMRTFGMRKRQAEKEASRFLLFYGWKSALPPKQPKSRVGDFKTRPK